MLYIDIETYSPAPIEAGVYRYSEHLDFRLLMVGYALNDEPVTVIEGDDSDALDELLKLVRDENLIKVAHNAAFERICFSRIVGLPVGSYLDPRSWHDTQAIAAELSYPQKLEPLAKALKVAEKDTAGTRLINMFSKPNRKGARTLPEEKPSDWEAFRDYCRQDVETLREVHQRLGGWPTRMEHEVYLTDQRINDLGIKTDVELAELAVEAASENRMLDELRVMQLTGVDNPSSQPQMLEWVRASGLDLPNLRAETIKKALGGPLRNDQRVVLTLRQELALTASKKFQAALDATGSDGRLRGSFRFFGAHTGRWSGRGVQLQNLPRASLDGDAGTEAAILDLKMGYGASGYTLKALVRSLFTGPFTVVDYAAIEARVVAWLAGEQWALDAFAEGRDIYVETAERMSTAETKLDRSQGKVAVLALGYNGGVNSLRAMGATGSDEELRMLVAQWRHANQNITGLWADLQERFKFNGSVGDHLSVEVHPVPGSRRATRILRLPSGRGIHYRNSSWETYTVTLDDDDTTLEKSGWRFEDPKGFRVGTYGGRLVENVTQAVARDILAEALVRLQEAGYRVVGHVHDEVLIEGVHPVEEITAVMTQLPKWAEGLPLDGAGFNCYRYRKG